ncbi:RHS repeat domain-containing protein [Salininema proteolyticum]|uniref:RHS repeat-associated core domain-containing protein n=1 Tax=Salininema proteolyticum TaxID=1607685 RepID=A0ABV8U1A4_9ACTN
MMTTPHRSPLADRPVARAATYSAAVVTAAAAALLGLQLPVEAQSGDSDPDLGTPVGTTPVSASPVDLIDAGLETDTGKITVPGAGGAGGSSATGDWSATDLSHAGSWAQGGSTGGFTYSYGMDVPEASGPVPALGLSYSSQAVDGHTSSSNNQAGVIGDGWSYTPGYVERTYTRCALEEGGNTPSATGDRCWEGDSPAITMVLNGVNTSLVLDDDTGNWVSAADPGMKIELLGTEAEPGSGTSERWKVTSTDGTVYAFGARAGDTDSRLTMPVFGNHSDEACFKADDFAESSCRQAYRWMLDEITDLHGNQVQFEWTSETGHYGAAADVDNRKAFHRSVRLTQIDYGLRSDDDSVQSGRVKFAYDDRCEADCRTTGGDPKTENWPETPWDEGCAAAPCEDVLSPAFFHTKRLTEVATFVPTGTVSFSKVDSWTLVQEFLDYGDGEETVLWLKTIQQTGHIGGIESTPPVRFSGIAFPNRVEHSEGTPSMWRTRLTAITSETGSVTGIWYSAPDCNWDDLPDPLNNSRLCYPSYSPDSDGDGENEVEWYHKYVVAQVAEFDTTGGQVPVRNYYDYSTDGGGTSQLWAWDDSEFTDDDLRTYNQWRGYPQVTTKSGQSGDDQQLTSRTRFYRGMDGQPTTASGSGSRDVVVTDEEGNTVPDHEALTGAQFESASYDEETIIESEVSRYWTKLASERTHDGGSLKSWHVGQSRSDTRKLIDQTTDTWMRTRTSTSYDDRGRPVSVSDDGDLAVDDDQLCTRTWYADNPDKNIHSLSSRVEAVAVTCDETAVYPSDLVSDTRTYYDGATTIDGKPTRGLVTKTETADEWNNGAPVWVAPVTATYDKLGRVLTGTDALGRTTTRSYTPADGNPVESVSTTNPLGHVETVHLMTSRSLPVKTVDANGRYSEIDYDALGRNIAVWAPGWSRTEHPDVPTAAWAYDVSNSNPSTVTTYAVSANSKKTLRSVTIYDSLLREVQQQEPTAVGGRLVTGIEYDTRGLALWNSGPNWNVEAEPNSTLVSVTQGEDQARTFNTYDGAGRVVKQELMSHQEIIQTTETAYGGSTKGWMVRTIPPEGGTATGEITNAQGELVEKRTYHDAAATGDFDATVYDYTPRGNLDTVTDPTGNEWAYAYDLRGRQTKATDPDTGTTTAKYDVAGQLIQTIDAGGQKLTTTYDKLGRKYNLYDGDEETGSRINAWRYDQVDGGLGLPHLSVSSIDGTDIITEVRKYDDSGRPTSVTQWVPEIPGFEDVADSYNIQQFYFPDGSVRNTNLPQIGGMEDETVIYSYNDLGQMERMRGKFYYDSLSTDYVSEATYTAWGELAQRVLGENSGEKVYQTWTFEDGTRRLDQHRLSRDSVSSPLVAHLQYEYDEAGNILSIADSVTDSPGQPERQCFAYDYLRRLTDAWAQAGTDICGDADDTATITPGGPGEYWTQYEYDVTGNRTTVTDYDASGTPATTNYSYSGDKGHLLDTVVTGSSDTSYGWDETGNLTERTTGEKTEQLSWNAAGKLDSMTTDEGTTKMLYDGEGNRFGRIDPDGSQNLFVAGHEITVNADGAMDVTRTYSHNGDMIATRSTNGELTWIGTTHQGTAAWAILASTMAVTYRRQDPFGNKRGETTKGWSATQQGFHTGTEDPTGLVSMGARFYDSNTGRLISRDPIANFQDSQQVNGYSYANNNPIGQSDPTGLTPQWDVLDPATGCSIDGCWVTDTNNPGSDNDTGGKSEGTKSSDEGLLDSCDCKEVELPGGNQLLVNDQGDALLNGVPLTGANGDLEELGLEVQEMLALKGWGNDFWGTTWALYMVCSINNFDGFECGQWTFNFHEVAQVAECATVGAGCDDSLMDVPIANPDGSRATAGEALNGFMALEAKSGLPPSKGGAVMVAITTAAMGASCAVFLGAVCAIAVQMELLNIATGNAAGLNTYEQMAIHVGMGLVGVGVKKGLDRWKGRAGRNAGRDGQ